MTSYQKLKAKCQELQNQVNIFKNALTIIRAEPKLEFDKDGKCFITSAYYFAENKIEYEAQVKLTNWVIKNIDRKIIKEWLERTK